MKLLTHSADSIHTSQPSTAILLVNLGTPKQLTFFSVLNFLREFLGDKRVVELPRFLWWLILYTLILPFRTRKALKLYQKIWTKEGSPLRTLTENLGKNLEKYLSETLNKKISVIYAMTYGYPSVKHVIKKILSSKIDRLIVLPLFPQYSSTTTAAVFDKVMDTLKLHRYIPSIHFINDYSKEVSYLNALVDAIVNLWNQEGQTERLLFSFHGIPMKNVFKGDPYRDRCERLAIQVAKMLKITENSWNFSFQSRFGWQPWLVPNTQEVLMQWAAEGVKSVTVISPSFAVDCLETLEELNIENRNHFLKAGGECYHYVRALNDTNAHVSVLASIIKKFF